jgi:hypothetical protein
MVVSVDMDLSNPPTDPTGKRRPDRSWLQHEDGPVSDDDRPVRLKDALVGDKELLDLLPFFKVRLSKTSELLLRSPKAARPQGAPRDHADIVPGPGRVQELDAPEVPSPVAATVGNERGSRYRSVRAPDHRRIPALSAHHLREPVVDGICGYQAI